jgi:hypothetical protein
LRLIWFCLLAGAIPGCSETRVATFAPITLYTQFEQAPPAGVLEALQVEVDSIMAPIGLRFQWRDLGKTGGHEVSAELAVITFKGRCDGQILPFTDISCDRIRQFTQPGLMAFRTADRAAKYGRALGRVLAHELYHIFANTMRHGSIGVAKESYSTQDLLADDFLFQAKESRMLRTNRQRAAVDNTVATM